MGLDERDAVAGLALEHGSSDTVGESARRAGAPDEEVPVLRDRGEIVSRFAKPPRIDGRDDDRLRAERICGLGKRRTGVSWPKNAMRQAALAEQEAERDKPEVVALAGGTREHRERPSPRAPASSQAQEAAADQARREVLLGGRGLASLPAVADLTKEGQDETFQEGAQGELGDRRVKRALALRSSNASSAAARRSTRSASTGMRRGAGAEAPAPSSLDAARPATRAPAWDGAADPAVAVPCPVSPARWGYSRASLAASAVAIPLVAKAGQFPDPRLVLGGVKPVARLGAPRLRNPYGAPTRGSCRGSTPTRRLSSPIRSAGKRSSGL